MGLFGSYERAGAGIAKNAPQKKPFFRFWEIVGRKFWKLIEVNLLLMLGMLPLIGAVAALFFLIGSNPSLAMLLAGICLLVFAVTFGPTIAGCTKILRNFTQEKPMFLMTTFGRTFKSCFKQSFAMGIIDLLVIISAAAGFYVYPKLIAQGGGTMYYVLFIAGLSVAIAVLMMSFYAYLMIVSTDLSMKNILKNSLALSCIALKKNLITLGILAVVTAVFAVLLITLPIVAMMLLPFMPVAFMGLVIVFNCYPIIQKYVINPYYAQRGEVNPELRVTETAGENVFEDQGGKETPIEPKKVKKKGKVIS